MTAANLTLYFVKFPPLPSNTIEIFVMKSNGNLYIYEKCGCVFQLYAIAMSRFSGQLSQSNVSCKPDMIYLLTTIGLTSDGRNTVHIYTQTIYRTTHLTTLVGRLSGIRNQSGHNNWEECGPSLVFVSYILAFALQLRKKHGRTSVSVE